MQEGWNFSKGCWSQLFQMVMSKIQIPEAQQIGKDTVVNFTDIVIREVDGV